ncbi:SCP2 sterol-binding domain-containing protein [Psychrobacter arenosus]|jgi:putative sterol carrier protein|uniref:SCP2 sterol-binding domain-containing protein n=1 Tax=Psychrobacter arenosus TaxID=256326 RepID=UPI001917D924|nr:SCP2 sterol-binding domain-containing protein [Psychrobacter arenosus]
MAVFLSEDWFNQVETLGQEAGDLNLPPSLENMTMNLKVNDGGEEIQANLTKGLLTRGLNSDASTTLLLDKQTLLDLMKNFDMNSAMGAFMSGKIRVEGDMSQLMTLQTAKPSSEQAALFDKIKSVTEFA